MKRILLFSVLSLLISCVPATVAPIETSPPTLFAPTEISPTKTPSPPTPTESRLVLTLDKPMTEVFDVSLSNIDAMPDVNENQEHQISSGQLAETVNAKWLEDAKQGKESPYDKGGTVILHPGVIPINLGDFQITIWSGQTVEPGKVLLIFPHENTSYVSAPFQPSNELFHLPEQGENAVLMTEKLYYKDKENKLHVIPVFFYVDNMEGHFGDAGFFMGHGFENISIPVLSFASDDDDNKDHSGFIVVSDYLAEPMQALRDQIISDVQNGVFDPSDLSKAWFAPQNVW